LIQITTDKEFLLSIGVEPYDPEQFVQEEKDRVRTMVVQVVAILQLAAIVAGLVWTSI
jgi:hypothetical protein